MSFYRSFCSIFQSWINGAVLSLNSYFLLLYANIVLKTSAKKLIIEKSEA